MTTLSELEELAPEESELLASGALLFGESEQPTKRDSRKERTANVTSFDWSFMFPSFAAFEGLQLSVFYG
jgi:hypothetical protein